MVVTTDPPTFDRRDAGTEEEQWRASGFADGAAPLDLAGVRRLIVVSAHPDDESLGAAGLIGRLNTLGARVLVIVASDGEASHPDSPTHCAARIAERRREEMSRALAHLAPGARLCRLALPDGRLAAHLVELLSAVRREIGPDPAGTLLVAPWRDDGHPDHEAVARAAEQLAHEVGVRLLEFPVWAWLWARADDPRLHPSRLTVLQLTDDERGRKLRAIDEHRSQISALSDAPADQPVLGPAFLEHFRRPYEVFLPVGPSLTRGYFERLYAESADPWRLAQHWYEERKRAVTVAALTRPRFRSAFEPGCATGLLTELLAPRCSRLLATDIAPAAVRAARRRLAGRRDVDVQVRSIPADWPSGTEFDLVVLSEVGYYCDRTELSEVIARTVDSLAPDGLVLACHWRHPAPGYPLTGDQVHTALIDESGLRVAVSHLEDDFRLDALTFPGTPSVARWEGVLR